MANRKNTNAATPAAATPAAATPAAATPAAATPAATKYTVKLAANGGTVTVQAATAAAFYAVAVDGKAVFTWPATATVLPAGKPKACKAGSYQNSLLVAFSGNTMQQGVANMVLHCSSMGAVPAKYATSYAHVAAWLAGGQHPGASHVVNVAQHLRGYISGWLLKPAHGAHAVQQ